MHQGVMDLIGFGVAGSIVLPMTTVSIADSATSSAATITVPAGVIAGDLLILLERSENAVFPPSSVIPTGFTSIVNTAFVTCVRQILSYKLATGSEASTSLSGMTYDDYTNKLLYVFRGDNPIVTVTPADAAGQIVDTDPTAQVVNASGGIAPLIVIGAYSTYNFTGDVDPRTFSTTKDGEINITSDTYLAYKIYNSSPADTTIDMADEGFENALQSCYIQVA